MRNILVTLCNEKYVPHAKQVLASAFLNSGWQGDYAVLTDGLSDESKNWFRSRGVIVLYPDPITDRELNGYPPIIWQKCHCFSSLFDAWDHVIFLDADVTIRQSIDGLLEFDQLGAWGDSVILEGQFKSFPQSIYGQYNAAEEAFNVGVMSIPRSIRSASILSDIKDHLSRCMDYLKFPEQAILNIIFYKKWKYIPFVYNCNPFFLKECYLVDTSKFDYIAIMHFFGSFNRWKPWNKGNDFYDLWMSNTAAAEDIDFTQQPPEARPVTKEEADNLERVVKAKKVRCRLTRQGDSLPRLFGKSWKNLFELDSNRYFREQCSNPTNCPEGLFFHFPRTYTGRGSSDFCFTLN